MSLRVLLVEDDAAIADALVYALEKDGIHAEHAATLAAAAPRVASCDVILLDLGLPDGSGFSLLREVQRGATPPRVIILTSRDEEVDCVAALEAGADDYVTKPFSPRVVIARVRAVARRPREESAQAGGGLVVDRERREARFGDAALTLTKIELDILAALADARGRVLTREQLVEKVWGGDYALTPRTVDSHVKALRRKLDAAGAPEGLIETLRSVGFRLRVTP